MRMLKTLTLSAVCALTLGPSSFAQGSLTCLTGPDTRAIVTLMLDRGTEKMLEKCTLYPIAQGTPFLSANKDAISKRFDDLSDEAFAFLIGKIYSGLDKDSPVARAAVNGIVDELVASSFGDFSQPNSCSNADILSSGLATLEDEDIVTALTVIAQQVLGRNDETIPLPLCEAQ